MKNNTISRRTALKNIGLMGITTASLMTGISCSSEKNENPQSFNEKDIIPCNALDCPDSGCSSNNEESCCPSANNFSKKDRCDCKAEPFCPANIYISEHFIL